jgi:membrane protease YdiL (CAAX protease family)
MAKQWEFLQPKPYSGKREGAIALLACILWFISILVRHQLPESSDWSLSESLFEAFSFVVFAGLPIFGFATAQGERLAKEVLLPRQGLIFQIVLCVCLAIQMGLGKALNLSSQHFSWIEQLNGLLIPGQFWLNGALFLGGVFVALRIPFVVQALRQQPQPQLRWQLYGLLLLNTLYLSAHHTASPWEGFIVSVVYGSICLGLTWRHQHAKALDPQLVPSDFGLIVLCVAILYWFSIPSFSFGVFIGVDLFILVMVYGSGLGREHFGYSFKLRGKDWPILGMIVFAAVAVLVPVAIASGFVQPTHTKAPFSLSRLGVYFVLFTFRVGIFEEIFFRSGLMVLLRDWLQQRGKERLGAKLSPQAIVGLSALGCSLLFGLSHIGNEAGAHSTLTLWQYRGLYIVLATSASLFYAAAFAKTNRLAAPILIHGFVDTLAVVMLGGALAVPF